MARYHQLRQRARRATIAACGAAAGITLALFGLPLLFGYAYFGVDLTNSDLGMLCALQRLLDAGEPLWLSPHMGNGAPLFARPTAQLLYPLRWFALLFSPDLGASIQQLLHLAIAAAGCAWLCRSFGVRPTIAAGGGLAFVLTGVCVDLITHSIYLAPAAWLPVVWAASRRALAREPSPTWIAAVGLGLTALLLAGEPQAFAIGFGLIMVELVRVGRRRGAQRKQRALTGGVLLLCALCALALGAPQWLAFFGELELAPRSGVMGPAEMFRWSFDSALWPAALWPGRAFSSGAWVLARDHHASASAWGLSPYVGLLFVALFVCALSLRRARTAVVVAIIGLLFALGDSSPVLPLLTRLLPPLGLFRYPQKYLLICTLGATVAVACFLDYGIRRALLRRRAVIAIVTFGLAQVAILLLFTLGQETLAAAAAWPEPDPSSAGLPKLGELLNRSLLHASAVLLVAGVLLLLRARLHRWLGLVLLADLMISATSIVQFGPALSDLPSPLRALESAVPPVLCVDHELRHMTFQWRWDATPEWSKEAFLRAYALPERQACDGRSSPILYSPLETRANRALAKLFDHASVAAARALGCTYLVSDRPGGDHTASPVTFASFPEKVRAFLARGPSVWRIQDPVPLAFVVRRPRLIEEQRLASEVARTRSAAQALALIDDPLARLGDGAMLPPGDGAGAITLDRPTLGHARLRVEGGGPAVVGLRTSFQSGWQARQGDKRLSVVRASGQHVAVLVEDVAAGEIELRYRSPGLGLGMASSAGGVVTLGGLIAWAALRRRRRGRAAESD